MALSPVEPGVVQSFCCFFYQIFAFLLPSQILRSLFKFMHFPAMMAEKAILFLPKAKKGRLPIL